MKKLTLILLFISSITFAVVLTMKNYQCSKCATVIQSSSLPNSNGCPKGSSHSWHNLGEVGDKNYQCKKCGTVIKTNSLPSSNGCPSGSSHSWSKL
jgi:hypothetical protein